MIEDTRDPGASPEPLATIPIRGETADVLRLDFNAGFDKVCQDEDRTGEDYYWGGESRGAGRGRRGATEEMTWQAVEQKVTSLAGFDGSVIIERTAGEVSARCHYKEANFLALNLMHDVVTGAKSVEEARSYYAKEFADYRCKKQPGRTRSRSVGGQKLGQLSFAVSAFAIKFRHL